MDGFAVIVRFDFHMEYSILQFSIGYAVDLGILVCQSEYCEEPECRLTRPFATEAQGDKQMLKLRVTNHYQKLE